MIVVINGIEYTAFPYETLEEAKENLSIGQAILTDNDRYYVVKNSDVEQFIPLDYFVVS